MKQQHTCRTSLVGVGSTDLGLLGRVGLAPQDLALAPATGPQYRQAPGPDRTRGSAAGRACFSPLRGAHATSLGCVRRGRCAMAALCWR